MGATCAIMAGTKLQPGIAKAVITQHPGICGPIGPPPFPDTWMEGDFAKLVRDLKTPTILTTATNDGAFWPAPLTAKHEYGCYEGSMKQTENEGSSIFVQFSSAACQEDHKHPPWSDAGHDCPFKIEVETPWVLTAYKLYAQQNGSEDSECYRRLWGNGEQSLQKSKNVEKIDVHNPNGRSAEEGRELKDGSGVK
jgi:hypothetical protein